MQLCFDPNKYKINDKINITFVKYINYQLKSTYRIFIIDNYMKGRSFEKNTNIFILDSKNPYNDF